MMIKSCKLQHILIDSRCFRKGILLELTREDGKVASAEISPLPGYSKETLEEAFTQLKNLKKQLLNTVWTKETLQNLETQSLYASVYFGVESALLDLIDPSLEETPCRKYALLIGSPDEIMHRAEEVYDEGFRLIKIKLGHFHPDIAHQLVEKLQDRFSIRLDLNRRWEIEDTIAFCKCYPQNHFEYIEEPSLDPEKLVNFPYPYALDETLRDHPDLSPFLQSKHLKALVIKPTMTYPLLTFLNLGPKIVLTSSFESRVGIAQIEKLAYRLGLSETYHGLDTLRYFEKEDDLMSSCRLETANS